MTLNFKDLWDGADTCSIGIGKLTGIGAPAIKNVHVFKDWHLHCSGMVQ